MADFIASIGTWLGTLLAERSIELVALAGIIAAWRWYMGKKFQKQIDDLKKQIRDLQLQLNQTTPPRNTDQEFNNTSEHWKYMRDIEQAKLDCRKEFWKNFDWRPVFSITLIALIFIFVIINTIIRSE